MKFVNEIMMNFKSFLFSESSTLVFLSKSSISCELYLTVPYNNALNSVYI